MASSASIANHDRRGSENEPQEPPLRLFTVDEYYKMAEVGILRPDERAPLIEGIDHPDTADWTAPLLQRDPHDPITLERAFPGAEIPSRLRSIGDPNRTLSQTLPSFGRIREAPRTYESRHPRPENDILFAIEVADSTLRPHPG